MTALHDHHVTVCPACAPAQLARNHYFTGKLLVERDFRDEQVYFLGKHDRHNRVLHGWGVACGLLVRPHPHCPDQYVVVEPGTAFDCCGRELLVGVEQHLDVRRALERAGFDADADPGPWDFQICLRYAECGSEPIPAVFDDCPDDRRCEPNRITQSFELSVRPFDPATAREPAGVTLRPGPTVHVPGAFRAVSDEHRNLLHVLEKRTNPDVVAFEQDHYGYVDARRVGGAVEDLAVSDDGDWVYVASAAAGAHTLYVARVESTDPAGQLTIPSPGAAQVAAAAGGAVYVLTATELVRWTDPANQADADVETLLTGADLRSLALAADGAFAVVGAGDGQVHVVDVAGGTAAAVPLGGGFVADLLVLAETTAGPRLLAAEAAGRRFAVWELDASAGTLAPLGAPVAIPGEPLGLVASPGGRWAFALLVGDDGRRALRAVDAFALAQGQTVVLGAEAGVNRAARDLAVDAAGRRLFVAYQDDDPRAGGVQVVEVLDRDCEDLLEPPAECPACGEDDHCVVLATVTGHQPGADLTETQIDNRTDRRSLPSAAALAEAIRCLMERGGAGGAPGSPGPQGPPGQDGADGQDGQDGQDGADGRDGRDGRDGQDGRDGIGLEPHYVHVAGINWPHAGELHPEQAVDLFTRGLLVGFDADVLGETLNRHTVELLARCGATCDEQPFATYTFQHVESLVVPVIAEVDPRECAVKLDWQFDDGFEERLKDAMANPPSDATGVLIVPLHRRGRPLTPDEVFELRPTVLRVLLRGNFILGSSTMHVPVAGGGTRDVHPALDGNHFAPGLPDRCPSGDLVEGGDFESWFELRQG